MPFHIKFFMKNKFATAILLFFFTFYIKNNTITVLILISVYCLVHYEQIFNTNFGDDSNEFLA
jgi:diacylglycerol kinase